jgi:hypothetical protein
MPSGKIVPFDELSSADLVVDAVYQSGRRGNHSDDPISHILKVSNQGGFRYRGSLTVVIPLINSNLCNRGHECRSNL